MKFGILEWKKDSQQPIFRVNKLKQLKKHEKWSEMTNDHLLSTFSRKAGNVCQKRLFLTLSPPHISVSDRFMLMFVSK